MGRTGHLFRIRMLLHSVLRLWKWCCKLQRQDRRSFFDLLCVILGKRANPPRTNVHTDPQLFNAVRTDVSDLNAYAVAHNNHDVQLWNIAVRGALSALRHAVCGRDFSLGFCSSFSNCCGHIAHLLFQNCKNAANLPVILSVKSILKYRHRPNSSKWIKNIFKNNKNSFFQH